LLLSLAITATTTTKTANQFDQIKMFSSSAAQSKFQQLMNCWRTESVPFITVFVVSGLLAILIPAIKYRR